MREFAIWKSDADEGADASRAEKRIKNPRCPRDSASDKVALYGSEVPIQSVR